MIRLENYCFNHLALHSHCVYKYVEGSTGSFGFYWLKYKAREARELKVPSRVGLNMDRVLLKEPNKHSTNSVFKSTASASRAR
jgi:hypothetical protein